MHTHSKGVMMPDHHPTYTVCIAHPVPTSWTSAGSSCWGANSIAQACKCVAAFYMWGCIPTILPRSMDAASCSCVGPMQQTQQNTQRKRPLGCSTAQHTNNVPNSRTAKQWLGSVCTPAEYIYTSRILQGCPAVHLTTRSSRPVHKGPADLQQQPG